MTALLRRLIPVSATGTRTFSVRVASSLSDVLTMESVMGPLKER
jgi:hypothetical protein